MKQFYGRHAIFVAAKELNLPSPDGLTRGRSHNPRRNRDRESDPTCLAANDQKLFPLLLDSLLAIFTEFLLLSRESLKNP